MRFLSNSQRILIKLSTILNENRFRVEMSEILSQKITNFSGQKIGNIKKKCQKKNKSRLKSTFFDISF